MDTRTSTTSTITTSTSTGITTTKSYKYEPHTIYHTIGWIFDRILKDEETALPLYELQLEVYPDSPSSNLSKYNIAHMLRFKDRERAIKLFESLTDLDVDAIAMLGQMYRTRDTQKAKQYFEAGVALNDAGCMYNLGNMYFNGNSCVPCDKVKALTYFRQAADLGHVDAIIAVSGYYRRGDGGLEQSDRMEVEWLEKIPSDKISQICKFNLGWYYIRRSRWSDFNKHCMGLTIMHELVQQYDDDDAMFMIGECYELGRCGLENDITRAREWYKRAADKGDYDASLKMMQCIHQPTEKSSEIHPPNSTCTCDSMDERYKYFCKALEIRISDRWYDKYRPEYMAQKKLYVEYELLERLYKELHNAKAQLEEYELRPPLIGGRLFREAMSRFNHVQNIED